MVNTRKAQSGVLRLDGGFPCSDFLWAVHVHVIQVVKHHQSWCGSVVGGGTVGEVISWSITHPESAGYEIAKLAEPQHQQLYDELKNYILHVITSSYYSLFPFPIKEYEEDIRPVHLSF